MPNKQFILSTGSLFHLPSEQIFAIAQKAGFGGIEIMIDNNPYSRNIRTLENLAKKYKIVIGSVHSPLSNCNTLGENISEIVNHTIKIAFGLKARIAVFHAIRKGKDVTDGLQLALSNYTKSGIIAVVENDPLKESNRDIFSDIKKLSQAFNFLCLDTSHYATTGNSINRIDKKILKRVRHIHLSDSKIQKEKGIIADDHLPIGEGRVDFTKLVAKLKSIRYEGYYCIELRPSLFQGFDNKQIIAKLHAILERTKSAIHVIM